MKRLTILLFFFTVLQFSWAQVPGTLSYQGILIKNDGTPVTDGSHTVKFDFFTVATAGAPVLSRGPFTVTTYKGVFTFILGSGAPTGNDPLPLALGESQHYVEVVADGTALAPRARLTTVPYALKAQSANTMDAVGLSGIIKVSGDKVGIGTSSPQKTLDVANKVAIFAGKNGDPTIRGINANGGWTRFGGNLDGGLSFWGNNNVETDDLPHLRINNNGNVGIGTINPLRKLEVNNAMKFSNNSTDLNDGVIGTAPFAPGLNLVGINTDTQGRKINYWGSLIQNESGDNLFKGNIDVAGKTRIDKTDGVIYMEGTKNKNRGLEWSYTNANDRYGITQASNGNVAIYTAAAYTPSFISFNLANDPNGATPFTELMRISHNGKVGIGTTAPAAPLHIAGAGITTPGLARAYFNVFEGIVQNTSSSGDILVRADGYFWASGGGYVATSDARIKNVLGKTDNSKDLKSLMGIEITDYKYIDVISNGDKQHKKVIAQQLQEVYPTAVNMNSGVIPNVFETAKKVTVASTSTIVETIKPHHFSTGDEVKLILDKKGEKTFTVIVINEHEFSVNEMIEEAVFVYGKKVDDLLIVDYDALTTLNISATQELSKQVHALQEKQKTIEMQQQRIFQLEARVEQLSSTISTELEAIKSQLNRNTKAHPVDGSFQSPVSVSSKK